MQNTKKKKIGDYFFNINKAINDAVNKFNDNKRILKVQNICKKLKWKGEKIFKNTFSRKLLIYNESLICVDLFIKKNKQKI